MGLDTDNIIWLTNQMPMGFINRVNIFVRGISNIDIIFMETKTISNRPSPGDPNHTKP